MTFLDAKHGDNWAIWEFRAEGTGYPDEAVYGRIRHYPWPDHHPPPFRIVPMIMASMRNWLHGEDDGDQATGGSADVSDKNKEVDPSKRVVVVHCKAGKGRSGTMACSYLISQCGWTAEDAMARFTERRMRPKFGAGVSIPSQLRWISYVDRWTKGGKRYVDREVEIVEVHVWGLRHGVKVSVEGFVDEGKKIRVFHTFNKTERVVVQGDAPGGGGVMDFLGDALSPDGNDEEILEDADYGNIVDGDGQKKNGSDTDSSTGKSSTPSPSQSKKGSRTSVLRNESVRRLASNPKSKTINPSDFASASSSTDVSATNSNVSLPNPSRTNTMASNSEPGGMAVIFRPSNPVRLPTSDVSISLERRNRAPASMGLTMVTAVAHVWINTFFEGRGPEQEGRADDSGVFDIEWDKMDGIKGSSRKGTRAADRISIVWRAVGGEERAMETPGVVVTEPGEGSPVPQLRAADWRGEGAEDPDKGRRLGLRAAEPGSAGVSRASSVRSQEVGSSTESTKEGGESRDSDEESLKAVKSAMPEREEGERGRAGPAGGSSTDGNTRTLSEHEKKVEATKGRTRDPDEASGAATSQEELAQMTRSGSGSGDGGMRDGAGDKSALDASSTTPAAPNQAQAVDDGAEDKRSGDTTNLGFVKRGKKLLPMHTHKDDESSADSAAQGRESSDGKTEDPQSTTSPVQK